MTEIHIPTTNHQDLDEEGEEKVAIHLEDGADVPAEVEEGEWSLIPDEVADELALENEDKITVTIRSLTHVDESRIGGQAADSEGKLDPFPLLQALIDEAVTDSNIRIHPESEDERKSYEQTRVADMATPNLAWFLYRWLGANRIMHNLVNAGGEIEHRKKKS